MVGISKVDKLLHWKTDHSYIVLHKFRTGCLYPYRYEVTIWYRVNFNGPLAVSPCICNFFFLPHYHSLYIICIYKTCSLVFYRTIIRHACALDYTCMYRAHKFNFKAGVYHATYTVASRQKSCLHFSRNVNIAEKLRNAYHWPEDKLKCCFSVLNMMYIPPTRQAGKGYERVVLQPILL